MDPTTEPPQPAPTRERRPADPLAVALANASLLGIGYLMLGRRVLAVLCAVASVVLVTALGTAEQGAWLQFVLFAWWPVLVVHGWFLAARSSRPPAERARTQRFVAVAVAAAVVATFVLVRLDANEAADDVDAAHRDGDCDLVLSTVDGVGFWQRVGDAPVVDGMREAAAACRVLRFARQVAEERRVLAATVVAGYERLPAARWEGARGYRADLLLDQAEVELREGLRSDLTALEQGFALLAVVREEVPERRDDVHRALEAFLDRLPDKEGCVTAEILDWVAQRQDRTEELDRLAEIVPQAAPAGIVRCADHLLASKNPSAARTRYQQLVKQYPSDPLAPRAKRGITLATYGVQLIELRKRVATTGPNQRPQYCRKPVPYGAAKPFRGPGPHRALIFGQDFQRNSLPRGWRAGGPANAVLIICAGDRRLGDLEQTCQYSPFGGPTGIVSVGFHKQRIPVRVFEVRTGRMVANTAVQIDGTSCPNVLSTVATPIAEYVESSTADIRNAYRPLVRG